MLMLIAKAMLELGPKETMNYVILLVQRFCLFAEHQETDFPLFIRSDKRSWQKYSKKKMLVAKKWWSGNYRPTSVQSPSPGHRHQL